MCHRHNRWCFISLALDRMELRGVVSMINRSDPSTKHWGTPKMSSMGLDRMDEILTDWKQGLRLLTTHSSTWPPRPNHFFNLSSRI